MIVKLTSDPKYNTNYCEVDKRLYVKTSAGHEYTNTDVPEWKLVVPKSLSHDLIAQFHNSPFSAHMGLSKTLQNIRRYFYWGNMYRDVKNYVSSCDDCKMNKATNYVTRPPMGSKAETLRPFQRLYVDFMGPYPLSKSKNMYLLVILDHHSRFLILEPVKQPTAQIVADILENKVFLMFSVPEVIVSDNGKQFCAKIIEELMKRYGVRHVFTGKYSPQANTVERTNRSILAAIRNYIKDNHQNWDAHIPEIRQALCNAVHSSTGYSPHFLVFGQHYMSHGSNYGLLKSLIGISANDIWVESSSDYLSSAQESVLKHLEDAYRKSESRYNLRSRDRDLKPGQEVFLRNFCLSDAGKRFCAKLGPKFVKVIVTKKVGNVLYEVKGLDGRVLGVYHLKDIKL